ncbi:hypothetical protein G0U57_001342, partial [Chelydra serpentina]
TGNWALWASVPTSRRKQSCQQLPCQQHPSVRTSPCQYGVLPFGLSTASRVFKNGVIMAAHLRRIQVCPYLSNWLTCGRSPQQVTDSSQVILKISASLGLKINRQKSTLIPTLSVEFIGTLLE